MENTYSGMRVAIDGNSWLHKGACGGASDSVGAMAHVRYCMDRLSRLIQAGLEPVVIFDGRKLPAKEVTRIARQLKRKELLERARAYENEGNSIKAQSLRAAAIEVTYEMQQDLIVELRARNISFLVAPYEVRSMQSCRGFMSHYEIFSNI